MIRFVTAVLFVLLQLAALAIHNEYNHGDTLRVLSFNILYGGDEIDFQKVVEVIQEAKPDIVGIQEAEGNIPRLASALGWKYYNSRLHLLSKYPIYSDTLHSWYYAFVEIRPGKSVALFNIHLPSDPYGPDLVRDGLPIHEVLENEYQLRYSELDTFEFMFKHLARNNIPIIVTGDFNSPSHRDWTAKTQMMRPHMHYPVDWVVTKRMEENGFEDTYRVCHPDPHKNPGITWTPASPPIVGANETHDRIDFIWTRGVERILNSTLIGEALSHDVSIAVNPFPSDHRAVLSTFIVEPVSSGAHVSAFSDSSHLSINIGANGVSELSVQISSADGLVKTISNSLAMQQHEIVLPNLPPAEYRISVLSGSKEIARTDVVHNLNVSEIALGLPKFEFFVGEPIPVFWEQAAGNRYDWIAVYADTVKTQADFYQNETNTHYLIYSYTGAKSSGSLVLDQNSKGKGWPLPEGKYRIHFLLDDSYTSLASIPFIVKQ